MDTLRAEIFVQLLQHPTFSNLQQTSLKVERAIFSNICNTLSEVKIPHSNNEFFLKRTTVMACLNVNSSSNTKLLSNRTVAKAFGVFFGYSDYSDYYNLDYYSVFSPIHFACFSHDQPRSIQYVMSISFIRRTTKFTENFTPAISISYFGRICNGCTLL